MVRTGYPVEIPIDCDNRLKGYPQRRQGIIYICPIIALLYAYHHVSRNRRENRCGVRAN